MSSCKDTQQQILAPHYNLNGILSKFIGSFEDEIIEILKTTKRVYYYELLNDRIREYDLINLPPSNEYQSIMTTVLRTQKDALCFVKCLIEHFGASPTYIYKKYGYSLGSDKDKRYTTYRPIPGTVKWISLIEEALGCKQYNVADYLISINNMRAPINDISAMSSKLLIKFIGQGINSYLSSDHEKSKYADDNLPRSLFGKVLVRDELVNNNNADVEYVTNLVEKYGADINASQNIFVGEVPNVPFMMAYDAKLHRLCSLLLDLGAKPKIPVEEIRSAYNMYIKLLHSCSDTQ